AETASELTILREAAEAHRRYGKAAVPNYVISKTNGVSDLLEVGLLLKEAGLLRPRERELDVNGRASRHAGVPLPPGRSWSRTGGDARLLRQQQGWWLPDLGLGTLQGRNRARRHVPASRDHATSLPRPRRICWPWRRPELSGHPRAAL